AALESRHDALLALGRHAEVIPALQTLVEQHPFAERFAAQLMLALYRSGRQADALAVAAATRARLDEELGIDPGAELQELETAVLRQSAVLDLVPAAVAPAPGIAAPAPGVAAPTPLVERQAEIDAVVRAIDGAAAGTGSCIAVTGDAGVGKTSVVRAACSEAGIRVLHGHCDPLSTPRPYGPLRDLAAEAGLTVWDTDGEVLIAEVCDQVVTALTEQPTVLVVEDLHWVDAATVEVLRFIARRSATLQMSLVVTYRSHEIGPQHPARPLAGDLARHAHATTVHLEGLSVDGVAALLASLAGESGPEPAAVHELTGGNPFFVAEIGSDPGRPLPISVRDALLDRTAALSADDLHLLQLAAVSPERLADTVLRDLGVDLPALGRLDATGLLARDQSGLAYRHELARQAVLSTVPPGGAPHLHARLLAVLEDGGCREPALLTHHAVAARDASRAFVHAREAAAEAARAGAHTDAAAFYEIALAHHLDPDPAERADLVQRLAFELYLVSRLTEAIDAVTTSFELWRRADDHAGLASAYDTAAVFTYYDADRANAERYADRAAAVAREAGLPLAHGAARATRGFLGYFRGELALARSCANEASAVAKSTGERMLGLRAEMVRTLADLATGDPAGRSGLLRLSAEAREAGWDELASTALSQLSYLDVEHGRLDLAQQVLDESIPFTVRRDMPICRHWQTAQRARLRLGQGLWDGALLDAEEVVGTAGMRVAEFWPLLIGALVPVRRGEAGDPAALDGAWELARSLDEPARRLAVLGVLAEVSWTSGVIDRRVAELAVDELRRHGAEPGAHWAAGELVVWLRRLDLPDLPDLPDLLDEVPPGLAEPHAATLAGEHLRAADAWLERGQPFAAALCLADSGADDARERAADLLRSLGAAGTLARVTGGAGISTALSPAH
ncbi:MAG TPA: BTAD domain-containing putative transcriptional regulator, partial [Nocardioides sp.]|nr:BTAD domain-containing putative transcriptional regulator [Nocardioides sp.]